MDQAGRGGWGWLCAVGVAGPPRGLRVSVSRGGPATPAAHPALDRTWCDRRPRRAKLAATGRSERAGLLVGFVRLAWQAGARVEVAQQRVQARLIRVGGERGH